MSDMEKVEELEKIVQSLTYWKDAVRLLDAIGETAIVVVDSAGIVMLFNLGAEILTGFTRENIIGQPVEVLIPSRLSEQHLSHRQHYMGNGPYIRSMGAGGMDLVIATKDRGEIPVSIMLNPVTISWGRYVMTVIRKRPVPSDVPTG